ncbi:META domain-containing protein [Oceanibium sediminis]|uniref:META domain-containing protein n=1 Tax=Oceanibium sediminis TaxID=2026339 RepID=UPI00130020A8|nr:META domain-containing protein [Oceanibium sediminis]
MIRPTLALAAVSILAACAPLPDTVGEAAPAGTVYRLAAFNDAPVTFGATVRLLNDGKVSGAGPCNTYTAVQKAPLPWLEITDLASTRRTCDQQRSEDAFFIALQAMDFAEIGGDSLLMTNNAGQSLFFTSTARDPSQP